MATSLTFYWLELGVCQAVSVFLAHLQVWAIVWATTYEGIVAAILQTRSAGKPSHKLSTSRKCTVEDWAWSVVDSGQEATSNVIVSESAVSAAKLPPESTEHQSWLRLQDSFSNLDACKPVLAHQISKDTGNLGWKFRIHINLRNYQRLRAGQIWKYGAVFRYRKFLASWRHINMHSIADLLSRLSEWAIHDREWVRIGSESLPILGLASHRDLAGSVQAIELACPMIECKSRFLGSKVSFWSLFVRDNFSLALCFGQAWGFGLRLRHWSETADDWDPCGLLCNWDGWSSTFAFEILRALQEGKSVCASSWVASEARRENLLDKLPRDSEGSCVRAESLSEKRHDWKGCLWLDFMEARRLIWEVMTCRPSRLLFWPGSVVDDHRANPEFETDSCCASTNLKKHSASFFEPCLDVKTASPQIGSPVMSRPYEFTWRKRPFYGNNQGKVCFKRRCQTTAGTHAFCQKISGGKDLCVKLIFHKQSRIPDFAGVLGLQPSAESQQNSGKRSSVAQNPVTKHWSHANGPTVCVSFK